MAGSRYLDLVNEKVVVYDGAFGTYVQTLGLGPDDFGGEAPRGLQRAPRRHPARRDRRDARRRSSRSASTSWRRPRFGAFAVPLGEYGIADRSHELNLAAARIAREVADGHGGLVAGSIGPGTKFASLGQIRFAELRDAYEVQARGLLEGGVDLLLVETQFDLLGAKAAMIGCRRAMAAARPRGARSRCRSPWSSPARCCPAPRSAPPWPPSTPCGPTSSASTAPPAPPR